MRLPSSIIVITILGSALAQAQPNPADAAIELKLFLEKQVRAEHRVTSFQVVGKPVLGPIRRSIRYEARIEFPAGITPTGRQALQNESIKVVEGRLDELSSRRIVLDLKREAKFRKTPSGWAAIVGTTHYLIK